MMNKNFIIKSGLVIILFSIAIYEDNRVISFIFFTLPKTSHCIIVIRETAKIVKNFDSKQDVALEERACCSMH